MEKSNPIYRKHLPFGDPDRDADDSYEIDLLRALNNLTNNVHYIFDYTRDKLIYPDKLMLFINTVKYHKKDMFKKLGINNFTQLLQWVNGLKNI